MPNTYIKNIFISIWNYTIKVAQLDRALAYALLGNISSMLIGPVTFFLIANYFSPQLQGYYFTFGGLISLQFFIELGFGQTLIPFASHEWAKLNFTADGQIIGDPNSRSRLISLAHLSFKWYGFCAACIIFLLAPIGYFFLYNSSAHAVEWELPWFILCLLIGLNFCITPVFYLLQGCNEMASYWLYRLIYTLIYGSTLCTTIFFGFALWILPIAATFGLIWSLFFLWHFHTRFVLFFLSRQFGARISWAREFWPLQWRASISWLSANYTTFFLPPYFFTWPGLL